MHTRTTLLVNVIPCSQAPFTSDFVLLQCR